MGPPLKIIKPAVTEANPFPVLAIFSPFPKTESLFTETQGSQKQNKQNHLSHPRVSRGSLNFRSDRLQKLKHVPAIFEV